MKHLEQERIIKSMVEGLKDVKGLYLFPDTDLMLEDGVKFKDVDKQADSWIKIFVEDVRKGLTDKDNLFNAFCKDDRGLFALLKYNMSIIGNYGMTRHVKNIKTRKGDFKIETEGYFVVFPRRDLICFAINEDVISEVIDILVVGLFELRGDMFAEKVGYYEQKNAEDNKYSNDTDIRVTVGDLFEVLSKETPKSVEVTRNTETRCTNEDVEELWQNIARALGVDLDDEQ